MLDQSYLADDDRLRTYEIHPGDELLCLGYPLAAPANAMGFPILRSGKIASYPLIPVSANLPWLFDFTVFPGNSGGPVYFSYDTRRYGGALHMGPIQSVVGLLSQQLSSSLPEYKGTSLEAGVIVPAKFIIETLNLLPDR